MKRYSSLFILALIALLVALVFNNIVSARKDFYTELWGPAYLLVHGKNPYDTSSLKTELSAIWFPMAKGLFAPLGWLDAGTAAQVWFIFNVAELFVIVLLSFNEEKSPWMMGITGLFVYFFPPVINHFVLGQFSITAALCLLLAARLAQAKRDWLAAFFLALALTKPQLGLFAGIGLGIFYFKRDGWHDVIAFYAKTFCIALILSLPLFITSLSWVPTWFANMRANPSTWAQPSIFLMLSGAWKISGIMIALLIGLFFCMYIWQKELPESAIEWTLAFTTIFAPYIWS